MQKLNQNSIFRYVSSVRLAVPLMLIVLVVVAYGTVVESRYNTEYAGLVIYKSWPFSVLLLCLWLNIFFATISRIPFKKHHVGFVITHIGLLSLLAGGFITARWGIDGQLSIPEGEVNSLVVLSDLEILFQRDNSPIPQRLSFSKSLYERDQSSFSDLNDDVAGLFKIDEYIPFAKVDHVYETDAAINSSSVALSFMMKSQFFNVSEWLHSQDNSEIQMGPAKIRFMVVDKFTNPKEQSTKKTRKPSVSAEKMASSKASSVNASSDLLIIKDQKTGLEKKIKLSPDKKNYVFGEYKIEVIRFLKNAIVQDNKMVEGSDQGTNQSLELKISKGSVTVREILYAKFNDFSIIKDPAITIRFTYLPAHSEPVSHSNAYENTNLNVQGDSPEATDVSAKTSALNDLPAVHPTLPNNSISSIQGNIIEFVASKETPNKIQVNLFKNDSHVMSEILSEGQNIQTPWMGMQIFIGTIVHQAKSKNVIQKINPEKRNQLPGSAIKIITKEQKEFWLTEGQQSSITLNNQSYFFYYGRQTLELPMKLKLKNFKKVDYPGTDTPMSFESLVDVDDIVKDHKISMNEPLKYNGFTIYQASYSIEPGKPPVSVFSVNRDPGRFIKYLGSIILSFGIVIFTFMRSSLYRRWQGRLS